MIPIPEQYLNCSVYIYKTKAHAKAGELSGGSGFLVGVPLTENKEWIQVYAVTAKHVIENMPNPVLRLNLVAGVFDCIETNQKRWSGIENSYGDDLATLPLELEPENFRFSFVKIEDFISQAATAAIFPGDEIFMVGRFFSHEGKQQNTPSVRFGNISMMPLEPITNKYGHLQETFLVEQRSLPGYSGSPVFLFIDPTLPRPPMFLMPAMPAYRRNQHGPFLLGVDWLHLHSHEPLLEENKATGGEKEVSPKRWIKAHTGMAGVIPAWRLAALLNTEELVMQRKKDDDRITQTVKG